MNAQARAASYPPSFRATPCHPERAQRRGTIWPKPVLKPSILEVHGALALLRMKSTARVVTYRAISPAPTGMWRHARLSAAKCAPYEGMCADEAVLPSGIPALPTPHGADRPHRCVYLLTGSGILTISATQSDQKPCCAMIMIMIALANPQHIHSSSRMPPIHPTVIQSGAMNPTRSGALVKRW